MSGKMKISWLRSTPRERHIARFQWGCAILLMLVLVFGLLAGCEWFKRTIPGPPIPGGLVHARGE